MTRNLINSVIEKHTNENVSFISNKPSECQYNFIMQRELSTDSDVEYGSSDDDGTKDNLYFDIEESSEKTKYLFPDGEKYGKKISFMTFS